LRTASDAATPAGGPAIEFRDVTKRFMLKEGRTLREFASAILTRGSWGDEFCALEGVSFQVERGETIGIVGRNGSGKSTALKLMAGVTAPTSGQVFVRGRISPLIELGAGFHPDLTGRENVHLNGSILGMSDREINAQFQAIVDFAELQEFIDMPVKRYSSGMYVRLGFAVAVHSNPEVLLIDEVLSVGDAFFQEKCHERMRDFKGQGMTIVVVSHSAETINSFCDRAIWMDHGRLVSDGPAKSVVDEYMATVPHHVEAV
jgi:ABC-type polysaccharide/polyol phosphate transport system ATPase subunit